MIMPMWWRRARAYFRRTRLGDDLHAEIQEHLALRREQLVADGVVPEQADAAARRAFGNVVRVREEMHDGWGFPRVDSVVQDVRDALRLFRRSPGFAGVAVLSLSVGLGASATVFSIADAVLFRPLHVKDPGALRSFRAELGMGPDVRKVVVGAAPGEIEAMRQSADFAELVAFRTLEDVEWRVAGGETRQLRAELVSPEYFGLLGAASAAGRFLDAGDRESAPTPIVISERLWRSAFGGAPSAVARGVLLNGVSTIVVGVVRDFRGVMAERPADVFAPLSATADLDPSATSTMARLVMRLHPDVPPAIAEQRLAPLYRQLGPPMARASEVRVVLPDASRGVSDVREELRRPIVLGGVLVAVLMIVACANAGGLLVARLAARRTELGVRIAIGAGRARLMRQLVIEALVLAAGASLVALLLASVAGPAVAAVAPGAAAGASFDVRFDWRIVVFTAMASILAAAGAAAASFRQLSRAETASVLSDGARSLAGGRRVSLEALVAAQIGCSIVLVIVSIAMGRTLMNLRRVDPGFRPAGAVAITVNASGRNAAAETNPAYFANLYEWMRTLPQVQQVTLSQMGLLTRGMTTGTVDVAGHEADSESERTARLFFVGPDFFETAGMRTIAGETLGAREMSDGATVAVVTRRFAEFYFGSTHGAIGRLVNRDIRIVGVVEDGRYNSFRDGPVRAMFLPFTKAPARATMTFLVRLAGDQRDGTSAVASAIRARDPALKVSAVPMSALVDETMGLERFAGLMAAGLTLLALALAGAGVYATVAFSVAERRREVAVRFALGATAGDVATLMLRGPIRVASIGIALGLPCGYALMRAISTLLYGVPAFDPAIAVLSALGLLAVASLAAAVPAWRASAIDPQECLRTN